MIGVASKSSTQLCCAVAWSICETCRKMKTSGRIFQRYIEHKWTSVLKCRELPNGNKLKGRRGEMYSGQSAS